MEDPQLPQPDFAVISQSLRQLSEQVVLIENTPALGDAATILRELRDGFRNVNRRLDRMESHQKAEAVNITARLQNSRVNRPDQPLAVLHAYSTNAPIPNFPKTSETIAGFSNDVDINPILRHLEVSPEESLDERKRRLRLAIGLHERAV